MADNVTAKKDHAAYTEDIDVKEIRVNLNDKTYGIFYNGEIENGDHDATDWKNLETIFKPKIQAIPGLKNVTWSKF